MKKSNKLLLGGFLAVILSITAIHAAWYAKYKSGKYTIYNVEDFADPESLKTFPNIRFVSFLNLVGATVTFSETAQVENNEETNINYVVNGDTLRITGADELRAQHIHPSFRLNLPASADFSMVNSSVSFRTARKSPTGNPNFILRNSIVMLNGWDNPLQLGNIKVNAADSSSFSVTGPSRINSLDVQLSNSTIEYMEGSPGYLSILTDSASRISMTYKNLSAAKITTVNKQ